MHSFCQSGLIVEIGRTVMNLNEDVVVVEQTVNFVL